MEGSFYPIFAMLFGYGINMQYEKALRERIPFAPIANRLEFYCFYGLLHGLFIWLGDVLLSYAVMGFCSFYLWNSGEMASADCSRLFIHSDGVFLFSFMWKKLNLFDRIAMLIFIKLSCRFGRMRTELTVKYSCFGF